MIIRSVIGLFSIMSLSTLNADLPENGVDSEITHEDNGNDLIQEDLDQERDFLGRDGIDGSVW